MSKLLDQFNKEYSFLYENHDNVVGYDEALQWGDEAIAMHHPAVADLAAERNDILTSDREVAAFAFACEVLGL